MSILQDSFDTDGVEISYKTGSSYPEGGSGEILEVDLCSKCFTDKVLLYLKSEGG